MNFYPGDMVKVTTSGAHRIAWVVRQTSKRVTVEASNGTEVRSYSPKNVVLLNRRDPRQDLFQEDPLARQPVHNFQVEERKRLRDRMASEDHARLEDGILYWTANGAVVPPWVFQDAGYKVPATQERAYRAEADKSMARYRESQRNMSDEARAEMMFEMRAAFGPGEDVVNVLTGQRYRT